MSKIATCFCYSFVKPKGPASLVLFCESRDAVPEEEVLSYLKRSMEYAKQYNVFLVPGPFILKKRLCLCLISPQGKPLTIQKATHLNVLRHPSLEPSNDVDVLDTPLGRLALLPDVDIFHPEVARSAAMKGAEVLISTQYFDLYDVNPLRTLSGCWQAAQENQISVLSVSNHSCCACQPCAATADGSGFVLAPTTEFPSLTTLYPHKAFKEREKNSVLAGLNPEFCARYFTQLGR